MSESLQVHLQFTGLCFHRGTQNQLKTRKILAHAYIINPPRVAGGSNIYNN
jgi:hypothetical protein